MRTWISVLAFGSALGVISTAFAQQSAPPAAAPAVPPTTTLTPPPAAAPAATAAVPPPPGATPEAPAAPSDPATSEAPATPPPPPAELPPPPAASEVSTCLPSCRSGYGCLHGTCVSLCNPPCGLGEVCTGTGECSARGPDPLPGDPEAARRDRGFETHDGFFLRLTTGFGGGAVTLDVPEDPELTYSGGGWSSSVDIGGSPVQDLVIFGRLRGAWLIEPTLRLDDEEIEDVDGLAVNQGLLGAGLNYYIMPLNLYVGGVVGFAVVEAVQRRRNRDDESDSSEVGFGIDLDVGKEWWIDDNWGIGVALRLSLSAVPASEELGRDAMFGSGFIAILFSATYQ